MAMYLYECENEKCAHQQSEMHSMSENPEILCEICNTKCYRVITGGSAVHFKGTGFYETDYKKKVSREEIIDSAMNAGAHK